MPSFINASTTGSGGLIAFGDNSGILEFQTGSSTKMRIDSGGNVGIGTTAPADALDVVGNIYVDSLSAANNAEKNSLFFGGASTVGNQLAAITGYRGSAVTEGALLFKTTTGSVLSERMRITPNGGIAFSGATNYGSSGQLLQSNGDAAPTWISTGSIVAGSTLLTNTYVGYGASGVLSGSSNLTWSGSQLYINGGSLSTLTNSQIIAQRFQVSSTNTDYLEISNVRGTTGAGWNQAGWRIQQKIDSTWMAYIQFNGTRTGTNDSGMSFGTGSTTAFANTVSERMRIDIDGNVGIGPNGTDANVRLLVQNSGNQNVAWFKNFSGTRAAPIENADWPWPVMTLSGYGNFYRQNMLSFTLPNDAKSQTNGIYHTDDSVWNFSLNGVTGVNSWDNASGSTTPATTSTTSTGLQLLGPGNLRLGTTASNSIFFRTSNVDRAKIHPNGYMSIGGNLASSSQLNISGSNQKGGASYHDFLYVNSTYASVTTGSKSFRLNQTGGMEIVNAAYSIGIFLLTDAGALSVTNEITAYSSDKRLKTDVRPIDNAIDKVKSLNGIIYKWNDLANSLAGYNINEDLIGLFAQDVQSVLPQAVRPAPFDQENGASKSGEDYLTVQYEKLVPLLVEAIKEQQAIIERQQKQIDQIQAMLAELLNK